MESTERGLAAVTTPLDMANARLAQVERDLADLQRGAAQVFDIVANALRDEADERGWCSEYDTFVQNVNDELQRVSRGIGGDRVRACLASMRLATLAREYEVTHTVMVTFTKTVTARSEEDAVKWCDDNYDIEDALRNREWDDYEITEVEAEEQ